MNNQGQELNLSELATVAIDPETAACFRDASFPLRKYCPSAVRFLIENVKIPFQQRRIIAPMLEEWLARPVNIEENTDFYGAFLDVVEQNPSSLVKMARMASNKFGKDFKPLEASELIEQFSPAKIAAQSKKIDMDKFNGQDESLGSEFNEAEITGLLFHFGFVQGLENSNDRMLEAKKGETAEIPSKEFQRKMDVDEDDKVRDGVEIALVERNHVNADEGILKIWPRIQTLLGILQKIPEGFTPDSDSMKKITEIVQTLESLRERVKSDNTKIAKLESKAQISLTEGNFSFLKQLTEELVKTKEEVSSFNLEIAEKKHELRILTELDVDNSGNEVTNDKSVSKSSEKSESNRIYEKRKVQVDKNKDPDNVCKSTGENDSESESKLRSESMDEMEDLGNSVQSGKNENFQTPVSRLFSIDKSEIEAIFVDLIDKQRFGIACRFAQALEFNKIKPVLHWSCLELEACSHISFESADSSTLAFFEKVPLAEQYSQNSEHGNAIVFGALLRPAMLQSGHIRATMGRLKLNKYKDQIGELAQKLSTLDQHSYYPTLDFFARNAGSEFTPRTERAKQNLAAWINAASFRNAPCNQSTKIIRSLVKPGGEFNAASMEIENESSNAVQFAKKIIEKYKTRSDIKREIRKLMESNKNTNKLLPISFNYLLRTLGEGRDLLKQWVDSREDPCMDSDSDERNRIAITQEIISVAQKSIEKLKSASNSNDCIREAILAWLAKKISNLMDLLNGKSMKSFIGIEQLISREMDLIVGEFPIETRIIDPKSSEEIEKNESGDFAIVEFLKNRKVPSIDVAINNHIKGGAFRNAIRLLDMIDDTDKKEKFKSMINISRVQSISDICTDLKSLLDKFHDIADNDTDNSEEALRDIEYLEEVLNGLNEEKEMDIDEVATELSTDLPSDIYSIKSHLRNLDRKVNEILKSNYSGRRELLLKLKTHKPDREEEIDLLLNKLTQFSLAYLDDEIANITHDRSFLRHNAEIRSHFEEFYPDFVLEASDGSWPSDIESYAKLIRERVENVRHEESLKLMNTWLQISDSIKNRKEYYLELQSLLEQLNFQNVKITKKIRKLGSAVFQLKSEMRVSADAGWFLPPFYGSLSNGHYEILVVRGTILAEQLLKLIDKNSPTIVIFAHKLSVETRFEIAIECQKKEIPMLLIDELQVAFVSLKKESRLEVLFDCSMPFGYIAPYATNPGKTHREMFFGRKQEIKTIESRHADGILVYGGRQMGKSSLLEQVVNTCYDRSRSVLVFREDIKLLGSSIEVDRIWTIIAKSIQQFTKTKDRFNPKDIDKFISEIKQWIGSEQTRRILCLFDESDNFLSNESKRDFPNIVRMKKLMEDTDYSFKVVFAGLHDVQRMYVSPNSPLAHFGSAVCVGPLNTSSEDMEAAYELVVKPLRASGFKFEDANVPKEILSYVNFYPSLVQVFLKRLLEFCRKQIKDKNPHWIIPRSILFDEAGFGKFKNKKIRFGNVDAEIRSRFGNTLNQDPRYKLIANVMGNLREEGLIRDVMNKGLSIEQIHSETAEFWPNRLERLTLQEIRTILNEMEGCGILSNTAKSDTEPRYCLRSNQVLNMLGSKHDISDSILDVQHVNPPLEYDPTTHRQFMGDVKKLREEANDAVFSPLSDSQLREMIYNSNRTGIKFVLGLKEFGLNNVMNAVDFFANSPSLIPNKNEFEYMHARNERELGNAVRNVDESKIKMVLFTPDEIDIDNLLEITEGYASVSPESMRIVLLMEARIEKFLRIAAGREMDTILLRPWGHVMLQTYIQLIDETVSHDIQDVVLEKTGGMPGEVMRLLYETQITGTCDLENYEIKRSSIENLLKIDKKILGSTKILMEIFNGLVNDTSISSEELFDFANERVQENTGMKLEEIGKYLYMIGILDNFVPKKYFFEFSKFGKFLFNLIQESAFEKSKQEDNSGLQWN